MRIRELKDRNKYTTDAQKAIEKMSKKLKASRIDSFTCLTRVPEEENGEN